MMAKRATTRSTKSSLSLKRSPKDNQDFLDMSPEMKKTKAELRRQSLAKAKNWAADRKKKKDGDVDDDDDGQSKENAPINDAVVVEEEEEGDAVDAKLPLMPTRRNARPRRGTSRGLAAALTADDDAAGQVNAPSMDDESVGTTTVRRSSRRRTMNVAATAAPPKAPTRRSRRKTVTPARLVEEEQAAEIEEVDAVEIKVEAPEIKVEAKEEPVKPVIKAPTRRSRRKTVTPVQVKVESPEIDEVEATEIKTDELVLKREVSYCEEEDQEVAKDEVEEEVVQEEFIPVKEEVIKEETIAEVQEVEAEQEVAKDEVEEEVVQEEFIPVKEEVIKEETVAEVQEVEIVEPVAEEDKVVVGLEITQGKEIVEVEQKVEVKAAKTASADPKISFIGSLLSPVFFGAVLVQWTLGFATLMTISFDWWTLKNGPDNEGESLIASEREPSAILGLWLVTIVGYFVTIGAQSRAGWLVTTLALSMASAATKLMSGGDTSVPALPIYSYSGFNVNVPDMLVVVSLAGCVASLLQPKSQMPGQKLQDVDTMAVAVP